MAGTLAWFDLASPGGVSLVYSGTMVVARAAQESQNREPANVLELDVDSCANTFGVAPCTATGIQCYNTFNTCKDKSNYIKTIKTYKFGSRGLVVPGELVRPYISSVSVSPTEIKPGEGLAIRSRTQIKLIDEPDNDSEMDPYLASRSLNFLRDWNDNSVTGQSVISGSQGASGGACQVTNSSGSVSAFVSFAALPTNIPNGTVSILLKGPSLTSGSGVAIRATFNGTVQLTGYRIDWIYSGGTILRVLECTGAATYSVLASVSAGAYFNNTGIPGYLTVTFQDANIYASLSYPGQTTTSLPVTDGTFTSGEVRPFTFANPTAAIEIDDFRVSTSTVLGGTFWRRFQARNLYTAGRFARLRRGFVVSPFSWLDFDEQLFVIEGIQGPDSGGNVTVVLSDLLKLADRSVYPPATDGKLAAEMKNVVFSGQAMSGSTTTIELASGANPSTGFYVGMEVAITGGVGTGQREVITAYDGDTRIATVGEFLVAPVAGSFFEISVLSVDVGKGEQYGASGFIRIGDEIIEFTGRSGSVLSWPDSTYRGKFGTVRDDHNNGSGVQLCKAWDNVPVPDVLDELLTAANVPPAYIDSAGIEAESLSWMTGANITACISQPEKISDLIKEISVDTNLMSWWDPRAQKVKAKVNVPQLESTVSSISDDDVMGLQVERLDADRITQAATYYSIYPATANTSENKSFLRAEIRIDTGAESANEYNDVRADIKKSRWLSNANEAHVSALVARRVTYLRDAPNKLKFRVDPRTRVQLAELVDIETRNLTDTEGNAAVKRCRITKIDDLLDYRALEATTTTFAGRRWGFIAPNSAPVFSSATDTDKQYAYIANSSEQMSDGTDAYRVI